jgi:hypothetical protein
MLKMLKCKKKKKLFFFFFPLGDNVSSVTLPFWQIVNIQTEFQEIF